MKHLFFVLFIFLFCGIGAAFAQVEDKQDVDAELDSLRKLDEEGADTVIFNAKFIRYTTIGLLQDSTQTVPIDTTLNNFENYSVVFQPERPMIYLGNLGLPAREMLFNPSKTIGFDPGFHSLDPYRLSQDSIRYYRARTPFTSLYYINGTLKEQVFRVTHSQNIKPNWNIGANYFKIGAKGFYTNQSSDDLNASVFTWYESPRKRYNLLVNGLFNTLKAAESGGMVSDDVFNDVNANLDPPVRLQGFDPVKQRFQQKNFFLKQFYYIGRLDSVAGNEASNILPTQRVSHTFSYSSDLYKFYKNQNDPFFVFPRLSPDTAFVVDSTAIKNVHNELMYSFYLRGRSVKFIKNEMKLDVGVVHDFYKYRQMGYSRNFQNLTFKANVGYRFSDRVSLTGQLNQIGQGRNAGDYLYESQLQVLLSKSVGRILLGAYIQNKSPEMLMERSWYTYNSWGKEKDSLSFSKVKYNNLSFAYLNPKFYFKAKADYYLINNYLYYQQAFKNGVIDTNQIAPVQAGSPINLLKISVNKDFHFGKFTSQTFVVLQKSDFQSILLTPEVYLYNNLFYTNSFFKKAVTAVLGFDSRWNSPFELPSYSVNVSQFYNSEINSEPATYPIIGVWGKFALKRANILVRYDYLNQGLLSKGYYTVNRYPMQSGFFKFGVSWNFYN